MARAAAKKKRDVPPLYMVVADGGRLDPAFQHDQERLMSFRKGTRLVVTVEPDGSRRGIRKWHAIIDKAVKASLLPWVTNSKADEEIRKALEMYDAKKGSDGSWHPVVWSLDALNDDELDEHIELMSALIYKLSGVDPDDFKREMHGAGDERFASDYDKPAADNQNAGTAEPVASPSGSANNDLPDETSQAPSGDIPADVEPPVSVGGEPNPADDSTSQSRDASGDSGGAAPDLGTAATNPDSVQGERPAGEDLTGLSASPVVDLSEEDRTWLRDGARMMLATEPEPSAEAKDVLFRQVKAIIMLMPKDASADARTRMEAVKQHCMGVCRGEADLDVPLVARTALASVAEITPAPVKTARAK